MEGAEAAPKTERERSPAKPSKEGAADQNGSRARDTRPRRDVRERRPRDGRPPPPGRPSAGDRRNKPERRLYVSNIPFDFQWQELKDLFRKEVGDVAYVEIFHDENGSSRGCGIIEFDSSELVDKALEKMHRFELKGRNIVVKEDFGVERDRYGRILRDGGRPDGPPGRERGPEARHGGHPGGGGGFHHRGGPDRDDRDRRGPAGPPEAKYANTYGLNVSFLESLGIDGPLVSRVFVANLDYSVDEQKLKEVFSLAGKVLSVEINKDHDGNSKGHGVVQFDHPVEAVQAISMLNNQTYMDRRISVRMDRVAERRDRDPKMSLPAGLRSIGQGLGANGQALPDVASKIQESAPPAVGVAAQLGGLAANLAGANGSAALGLMGAAPADTFGGGLPALGGAGGVGGLPALGGAGALPALAGLGQLQTAALGQLGAGAGGYGALAGLQGAALRGGDGMAGPADMRLGRGAVEQGLGGRGGLEQGLGGRGGLEQGLGGRGGMDQGLGGRGGMDQGLGGRGGLDQGLGGRGGLDPGLGGRGGVDSGLGGRGGMDHGLGGRGGMDHGLGGRGGMDAGLGGRSAFDSGFGGRGGLDQGLGGHGGMDSGRASRSSYGGGYGSSMPSSADSGFSSSPRNFSDSIIVSNLDSSYTWQMLRDKFRDVGEVRYADMKGKGVGVVRFTSPHEAQRAVSLMDGVRCDGRMLDIRLY